MRRIVIVLCSVLLVSMGTGAGAADTVLFPAHVNDSWMLQRFSEPASAVRVTNVTPAGWARFEGLFDMSPLWLKVSGNKVFTKPAHVLYDFTAAQGAQWNVVVGKLTGSVSVMEKDANVMTSFGAKTGCTAFAVLWNDLADVGVATQWFCPGIGLVKQEKFTIAGVETEYTASSAVSGEISVGYVGQGMNVRLDKSEAVAGSALKARLELWDTTGTRREFRSPTSQLFDLRIVNEHGWTVRLWSWDQVFLPVETSWVLKADKDFDAELPLLDFWGHPLRPGDYTVEGWIIDSDAAPAAKTQVRID
jgi:hypothetical protein